MADTTSTTGGDGADVAGLLDSLVKIFNSISDSSNQATANANAASANSNSATANAANARIQSARLALDTAIAKFNAAQDVIKTRLQGKITDQTIATGQEQVATSGQDRAQKAIAFDQGQQDRSGQKKWANALAKGMALGLKQRTSKQPAQQPLSIATAPSATPTPEPQLTGAV